MVAAVEGGGGVAVVLEMGDDVGRPAVVVIVTGAAEVLTGPGAVAGSVRERVRLPCRKVGECVSCLRDRERVARVLRIEADMVASALAGVRDGDQETVQV